MRLSYRESWKVLLDGKALAAAITSVQQEIDQYYMYDSTSDGLEQAAEETLRHFDRLHSLAQQGSQVCRELVHEARRQPYHVKQLQALAKALETVDEQVRMLGTTSVALKPITAMFRFGKENLQGWDLLPLAQQTLALYTSLSQQAVITSQVLAACVRAESGPFTTPSLSS